MQNLVTISIPLFKCEEFLERCLDSVRLQTYQNIEVSLINDQTPDNSVEIAENYIQKYQLENWKIIHLDENSGLSVVRNKGIDTANGKYLFFLDSDDEITKNCIESLVKVADETAAELTVSQIECVQQKTNQKSFCLGKMKNFESIIGNDQVFKRFVNKRINSSAVNKLFLVDFYRKNTIYFVPGLFAQDELWTFHSCLKLNRVAFSQHITYYYYLHQNSVIHNRTKRNFDNWFTIGKEIDKVYKVEKSTERKNLILQYLINFKTITLLMNWKAQKDEALWKESYKNYKSLSSLGIFDYLNSKISSHYKKQNFLQNLPTRLGFKVFLKRFNP